MNQEPNSEAAETVQTKETPAVAPAATCSASSTRRQLRQIMDVNQAKKSEAKCRNTLMRVRDQLERLAKELHKSAVVEYTGDFVLLRREGSGWAFVAIYNPDTWEGEDPEWDQCMPIPKLETIPEFDGW